MSTYFQACYELRSSFCPLLRRSWLDKWDCSEVKGLDECISDPWRKNPGLRSCWNIYKCFSSLCRGHILLTSCFSSISNRQVLCLWSRSQDHKVIIDLWRPISWSTLSFRNLSNKPMVSYLNSFRHMRFPVIKICPTMIFPLHLCSITEQCFPFKSLTVDCMIILIILKTEYTIN